MKNLHLNLPVALLTFGISVTLSFAWASFNSVDKRLASAIESVQFENIESNCKKKPKFSERCEKLKDAATAKQIAEAAAKDVLNANEFCKVANLSEEQCNLKKEAAIRDIEENMLGRLDERR